MSDQAVKKEGWSGAFGFIITSIGYAVGVGAIWKFPYMIGMNGGGVFLLICFILMLVIAIPLCWAELTLGRYTKMSAILGMRSLTAKGSPWVLVGWLGLATCSIMISYYITIVSDVMFYIFRFASQGLKGMSIAEISTYYTNLQVNMPYKFITVIMLYVLTVIVIMEGVQKGLERVNKVLIPGLFLFLVVLAIRGLMLPGGIEGIKWMFTPDFSKLTGSVIMAGLNQCFFLLLFAAGWSSVLGLYEGASSVIADTFSLSRKKSLLILTVILFILSLPTILSTTVWASIRPLGMDLFTFMDFLAMLVTLPIGAVIMSLFVGTKFWDRFMEHSAVGAKFFRLPRILKAWYLVILPVVTIIVMVVGIRGYF